VHRTIPRGPKTATIGVVVHDMTHLSTPAIAEYLAGIHEGCLKTDHHEQIFGFNPRVEHNGLEQVLEQLDSTRLDGVILLTWLVPDEDVANLARRMPVVMMSRLTTMPGVAVVGADLLGGTVDAVEHLLKLGHREIVLVTIGSDKLQGWQQREGLRVAMRHARHGARSHILTAATNITDEWIPEFRQLFTTAAPRPTAVLFGSPELAAKGLTVARELNLSIPRDLSVIVGNDTLSPPATPVPMTALKLNLSTVGREAVETLVRMVGEPALTQEPRFIQTTLSVRESTGAPPAASTGA
jgi:DNA-binding LacI/PurR family transcriptional regulator